MSIRRLKPTPNASVPMGDAVRADGEDIVFGASAHPGAPPEVGKIDPAPVFSIPVIGLASHCPDVIRSDAPNRAETIPLAARSYKLRGPRITVKMRDGVEAPDTVIRPPGAASTGPPNVVSGESPEAIYSGVVAPRPGDSIPVYKNPRADVVRI